MSLSEQQTELAEVGVERFTAHDYRPGTVTHIVLFRYGIDVSAAQRAEVTRRFHALADTERDGSPYIVSITSGPQVSGEVGPGGYDHGFVVTFESLGDRNFYVGEPVVEDSQYFDAVHAEFKSFVGGLLSPDDGVVVFDFVG